MKKNAQIMLILAIAIMVIFTLVREIYFFPLLDLIPNPDSAWLLYAAKRLLGGQKLYVDIIETNPPLIVWLSAIPVYLAQIIDGSPFTIAVLLVTLLNLFSLWLIAKTIQGQKIIGENFAFFAILLYISFGFFLFTPALYGQRETLFITLVLPYLMWSLNKVGFQKKIIFMAAIGCAIKPFFMLIWGINELINAAYQRNWRLLFAWHNWLIAAVQLVYLAAIYLLTPEYITDILPALRFTYFTYSSSWQDFIKTICEVGAVMLVVLWLAKLRGAYLHICLRVWGWFFACVGLILLQQKNWLNHLYPMLFMAGFLVVFVIIYLQGEWQKERLEIGNRKFLGLCLAVMVLISGGYLDAIFTYNMLVKPSKISQKILVEIDSNAAGKYIYPLAYNIKPSFPVITLSKGIFRGGFHQLWPVLGLIIRQQQGDNSPEFFSVKKWFFDIIVRDFTEYPPELVWVNENVNLKKSSGYDIFSKNRDIIAVLSQDERFAKIWQNYEKYGEVKDEVYPDEENKENPEIFALYRLKK
jgi:hypothetical protein